MQNCFKFSCRVECLQLVTVELSESMSVQIHRAIMIGIHGVGHGLFYSEVTDNRAFKCSRERDDESHDVMNALMS